MTVSFAKRSATSIPLTAVPRPHKSPQVRKDCPEVTRNAKLTAYQTDGNRVNQGIAEKLYMFVNGIALFFSAYIVALAVQWKLALITMSVIPAIVLSVGVVIKFDAPIEARIVSDAVVASMGTLLTNRR